MVNQRELTEEGLEKNFSTNTLGTLNYIALLLLMNIYTLPPETGLIVCNHTVCVKTKNKCHKHVVTFRHLHPHHGINSCLKEG